ncbi:sodium/calcium exchanger regulatory protein 1-like [Gigantopelta aegis]|uniref:sodium/calcium exchanger regulatory protein 1-like n=1 Tax=Gigantopelta aegis TaxID=1735272 RepID=UPI001B88B4EF|nr:sodium/calcium exchanger regulatory protein 1-like [Gigantopelta aegis]
MSKLQGKWKLHDSENWDEYMKASGVGFVLRKVGNNITTYEEITQDGDTWELHITSTFKSSHLKFQLGVEFDEVTMDGRNVKSLFRLEGDKLLHDQKGTKPGEVGSFITRELVDDDTMAITFVSSEKNVTAKRFFKRYT